MAQLLTDTGQRAAALSAAQRAVLDATGFGPPSVLGAEAVAHRTEDFLRLTFSVFLFVFMESLGSEKRKLR